ncbi:MAG: hypothetical protein ACR2IS_06415 [Nitrososphaeraceae archaeon]
MTVTCSVYLTTLDVPTVIVVSHTGTKLYKVESKSNTGKPTYTHSIFLEKAFVEDILFPFKPGNNLVAGSKTID